MFVLFFDPSAQEWGTEFRRHPIFKRIYVSQDGHVAKVRMTKDKRMWSLQITKSYMGAGPNGHYVVKLRCSKTEHSKQVQLRRLVAGAWMEEQDVRRLGLDEMDGYTGQLKKGYRLMSSDPNKRDAYALSKLQVCVVPRGPRGGVS